MLEDETVYPLAASAEAMGMQACLNCRPYRLAQTVARSGQELVCRAVRMIVAGALDQGTEADLATRLGLSVRHLRRMFVTHLGVTPDSVARSCRAHFARRLLDDTEISITEIAFMAGFGSVRQFNRDCRSIFRATPSQLRAGCSDPGRLAADGGLTVRLWFTGPLEWDALVSFLAMRAVPGVECVYGQIYRRTIVVDGHPGVLELGPGGSDHLQLRVHLPYWAGLVHLTAQARRIASLDEDVMEPVRWLTADPVIGSSLAARPGVRVPGAWDPFEAGVAAIIGQGLPGEESREFLAKLVGRFGNPVPGLGRFRLTHAFPTPGALTAAGTGLQAIGLARGRAETLLSFSSAVERGTLRLDGSMRCDQLISSITAIPGMTASAAHYIALRMSEPDVFPADDPVLQRALDHLAGKPSPEISHRWRPWRSYAAAHLWAVR